MTNVMTKLRRLPVTKRIELVDELIHSIAQDQKNLPLPNSHKSMLDKQLVEYKRNPGRVLSGSVFHAKIKNAARRLRSAAKKKTA